MTNQGAAGCILAHSFRPTPARSCRCKLSPFVLMRFAMQPKAAGRLLQQALPQVQPGGGRGGGGAAKAESEGGGGGRGGGRGRGRPRQRPPSAAE